jgi:hypothetical protein
MLYIKDNQEELLKILELKIDNMINIEDYIPRYAQVIIA